MILLKIIDKRIECVQIRMTIFQVQTQTKHVIMVNDNDCYHNHYQYLSYCAIFKMNICFFGYARAV